MLANDNNNREMYEMPTMNDDQGTLLSNEQTVTDDYVLSYRFVIEEIFISKRRVCFIV
jgi:hypothetical protein